MCLLPVSVKQYVFFCVLKAENGISSLNKLQNSSKRNMKFVAYVDDLFGNSKKVESCKISAKTHFSPHALPVKFKYQFGCFSFVAYELCHVSMIIVLETGAFILMKIIRNQIFEFKEFSSSKHILNIQFEVTRVSICE